MSQQYGGPSETQEERAEKVHKLNLSVADLFDRSKPWILVPGGSLLGYFDWVPPRLRQGPWSPAAPVYLFVVVYTLALCGIYLWQQEASPIEQEVLQWRSPAWYYNVACFSWMMYIGYLVYSGPAGGAAWVTYTMWTWTMVTLRHGLSALAPLLENNALVVFLLRYTAFPSICMATITVGMWNLVVGPSIYFFLKTPAKRSKFLGYFTNFRLTQLHVFVLPFAVLNQYYGSSFQYFEIADWYAALLVCLAYIMLYLLVLDRIGVHTYPIFSPRTHWCVLTWSGLWFLHAAVYWMWNAILLKIRQ